MIVTMQDSVSVGANSTVSNVVSGQRYDRSPFDAIGNLYCTGSAVGCTAELNIGGVSVTPPTKVGSQARYPVVPDDILVQGWEAPNGKLIQITVVNTTGAAITFYWRVDLEEVNYAQ